MARQQYLNAPTRTALRRGKIQRPGYTLSSGGAMGAVDLYLNPALLAEVMHGLSCSQDRGDLSPEGEWLLRDLQTLESYNDRPWLVRTKVTTPAQARERTAKNRARHKEWWEKLQSRYTEGSTWGLPKVTIKIPERK